MKSTLTRRRPSHKTPRAERSTEAPLPWVDRLFRPGLVALNWNRAHIDQVIGALIDEYEKEDNR